MKSLPYGLSAVAFLLLPAFLVLQAAEPRAGDVITSREDARHLPLPDGDDVFHFVIYGDRTGGQPEGVEILKQAVTDTNLLDPDLVMTVGDLVQGVCPPDQWMEQMKEYRGVMEKLNMPWYPVAGNHDVYWPRKNNDAPAGEFEGHFEKHFGPLWYAFTHKNAGFVVLYTDEGDPASGTKGFSKPEQTQMSPRQLDWLKATLKDLANLDHVFVFLHHPRWIEARYPDNNWPEVHQVLADAGNVRAVFAGHIHYLHYAGQTDGIEYFSLGATGASIPGGIENVQLGLLHHLNVVAVRKDGISVSVLPVGSVLDPKEFDARRQEDIHALTSLSKSVSLPALSLEKGSGRGSGTVELTLKNAVTRPIEIILQPRVDAERWFFGPHHHHLTLAPGETATAAFDWICLPGDEGAPPAEIAIAIDYLAEGLRLSLPEQIIPLKVTQAREKAARKPVSEASTLPR